MDESDQHASCGRVFFFFFKTGGIFGYVWTGPESLSKPMLLFKNAQIK